jgi:hypothetical protein
MADWFELKHVAFIFLEYRCGVDRSQNSFVLHIHIKETVVLKMVTVYSVI